MLTTIHWGSCERNWQNERTKVSDSVRYLKATVQCHTRGHCTANACFKVEYFNGQHRHRLRSPMRIHHPSLLVQISSFKLLIFPNPNFSPFLYVPAPFLVFALAELRTEHPLPPLTTQCHKCVKDCFFWLHERGRSVDRQSTCNGGGRMMGRDGFNLNRNPGKVVLARKVKKIIRVRSEYFLRSSFALDKIVRNKNITCLH